jgi:allantoinase
LNHFALRSQRVITNGEMIPACVEIQQQKIVAVHAFDQPLDCPVEDLGSLVLMSGLVDSHVHINEPGRTEWEGFNTATQAAAAGGITTLVDMPLNCIPVTINKAAFAEKLAAVSDKLWVDCGFCGGVVPQSIDDLDELLDAGVLGVKSFLIDSGIAEFPAVEAKDIRRALPILAKHDVPYLIHAELDGEQQPPAVIGDKYQSFLASRPKQWENQAVALMVDMAREAAVRGDHNKIHIVHLSSAQALDSISTARAEGLALTAETCPHYLTLWSENIPDGKTLFKCCPPIRENDNRQTLWQAVADGRINFIVSDHSPCTPQLKYIDSGDIEKAWGGISALQFGLPLIWTEAKTRGFSLVEINRLMSQATAEFAGLGTFKGQIAAGFDADLLVFDDQAEYVISNEMIKHKHKITPYVGQSVLGEVKKTYLRGQLVYCDDEFQYRPVGRPLLKNAKNRTKNS